VQEVQINFGIPVISIVGLDNVIQHVQEQIANPTLLAAIQDYRQRYGVDLV
jgi:orotate phosphoribosyltransferase